MSFTENLKENFNNKYVKFLTVGGVVASVANAFVFNSSILALGALAGRVAGAYAINEALKGNESIAQKTDSDVTKHMTRGAFLMVGATVVGITIDNLVPGIMPQITGTIGNAGAWGLVEGGVEKYKRRKPKM